MGNDLSTSSSAGCNRQGKDAKQNEKKRMKMKGSGLSASKTQLWIMLLLVSCFVAVAQNDVSHQHDQVSHADVPLLPVSPGHEGDIHPLMFFAEHSGMC